MIADANLTAIFSPASQLTLAGISGAEDGMCLLSVDSDERSRRCTGEQLSARKALLAAVESALGEGLGTRTVARALGISREVVRAIAHRMCTDGRLDHSKQQGANEFRGLARMARERLAEELDKIPLNSLVLAPAVWEDKAAMLDGESIKIDVQLGGHLTHEAVLASIAQFAAKSTGSDAALAAAKEVAAITDGQALEVETRAAV